MKFSWFSQAGRSMVEMLAVLAVVAVLSIGGFAGYNFAITKYRTNVLVDEINQRFVIAKQQATLGLPIDMSEFQEKIFGDVKIDFSYYGEGEKELYMEIKNLPTDIVEQLFADNSAFWQLPIKEFYMDGQRDVVASSNYLNPKIIPQANASIVGACAVGAALWTIGVSLWVAVETQIFCGNLKAINGGF